jgi:hypothetical protein
MPAPATILEGIASGVYLQTYPESDGGVIDFGATESGPHETLSFLVPWEYRATFMEQLQGKSRIVGGVDGTIEIDEPFKHPDYTDLVPVEVRGEPWGRRSPSNPPVFPATFSHAHFVVTFGRKPWQLSGFDPNQSITQDPAENEHLTNATIETEYSSQWITIPNSGAEFLTTGDKITQEIAKHFAIINYVITWHRHPRLPVVALHEYNDCVNDAVFFGRDIGTVYFVGAKTVQEAGPDGVRTQRVQMNFKWRPIPWNWFIRPDGNGFEAVVFKGSGDFFYEHKNLFLLLL